MNRSARSRSLLLLLLSVRAWTGPDMRCLHVTRTTFEAASLLARVPPPPVGPVRPEIS